MPWLRPVRRGAVGSGARARERSRSFNDNCTTVNVREDYASLATTRARDARNARTGKMENTHQICTYLALSFPSAGARAAPSLNILGSFFPTWMLCFLGAIVATVVVRRLLGAAGVGKYLPAPALISIALLVAFTLGGWLLWVD
jgi:hypothetical protein